MVLTDMTEDAVMGPTATRIGPHAFAKWWVRYLDALGNGRGG